MGLARTVLAITKSCNKNVMQKGFLNFYVMGIMAISITLLSSAYYFSQKDPVVEIPNDVISVEKKEVPSVSKVKTIQEVNKLPQDVTPTTKDISGYTFTITGYVYDASNAPAMSSGTPMAGIVVYATGPKAVTTKTKSNGSYILSFANAPVGTYDVCVTLPSGYTMNPPSGCEIVTVRLSEKYDRTLEFENNGHTALNGTGIGFNILRQQVPNKCPTDYNPFCGKDGKNYQNACYATKAGVEISYAGECRAGVTVTCDGYNGPMCGYDNKTYANECEINKAKVLVQYVGECQ